MSQGFDPGTYTLWSERLRGWFRTELPGSDAWLWPNNLYVVSKVVGAAAYELMLKLRFVVDQAFVLTASEYYLLNRHGPELGHAPKEATFAEGLIEIKGAPYAILSPPISVARADGALYQLVQPVALNASGIGRALIRAVEYGPKGNALEGQRFTLQNAPAGFESEALVISLSGGAPAQSVESFRADLLFIKRNPPSVGSPSDYERWAREVPGVTRAFATRCGYGPTTVSIYIFMDDTYADGIPSNADCARVEAYLLNKSNAGAAPFVRAAKALPVLTRVKLMPDTPDLRSRVEVALREAFKSRAVPSTPGAYGAAFTFSRSWIGQAIANVAGEDRHILLAPNADIIAATGEIAIFGGIEFV